MLYLSSFDIKPWNKLLKTVWRLFMNSYTFNKCPMGKDYSKPFNRCGIILPLKCGIVLPNMEEVRLWDRVDMLTYSIVQNVDN